MFPIRDRLQGLSPIWTVYSECSGYYPRNLSRCLSLEAKETSRRDTELNYAIYFSFNPSGGIAAPMNTQDAPDGSVPQTLAYKCIFKPRPHH